MEFVCKLGTPAGRVVSQTEQATSESALRHRLISEGFYIFSIQTQVGLRARVLKFRRARISPDDFLIFNQQFLTLSKSGLPLQKSLDLLVHQTRSSRVRSSRGSRRQAALRGIRGHRQIPQDLFSHPARG